MALTTNDVEQIRAIVREELRAVGLKAPAIVDDEFDGFFSTPEARPLLSCALVDALAEHIFRRMGAALKAAAVRSAGGS